MLRLFLLHTSTQTPQAMHVNCSMAQWRSSRDTVIAAAGQRRAHSMQKLQVSTSNSTVPRAPSNRGRISAG
jgi:hypothetical protein